MFSSMQLRHSRTDLKFYPLEIRAFLFISLITLFQFKIEKTYRYFRIVFQYEAGFMNRICIGIRWHSF